MAIPLTRIHILLWRRAERGRGTIGCPPFRVSLCYGRVRDRFCSAASKVDSGTRNKARAEGRAGGKGDRDRGPPSPYIISSPERVAIISRQWPTDRSASQKGPGPIIAATHRRRRSGQSWGPCAPSRLLFSPHGRIPSYRDGTRDVDYSTRLVPRAGKRR